MFKFFQKYRTLFNYHFISIKQQIFEIIRLTVIEILAIINWYSKIAVSNSLLTDVNIAHSDVNIDALFTLSKQHGYK